jgi:hypothetical protein
MPRENKTIWFPAKRYGWGWGPPNTWQGWTVMALYISLLAVSSFYFLRHVRVGGFMLSAVILTLGLLLVCWLKGERPKWRWGRGG